MATAFQLEKVLGIPASFWVNREKSCRQELYELEQQEALERRKDWLRAFPVNEMRKLGWLPDTREKHLLVDSLLTFFSVASPEEWERIYVAEEVSVSFRISLARTSSPHAISAWLRKGEIQASTLELAGFDRKMFREALPGIKELAFLMPEDFARQLQDRCAACGVAVVCTPSLPKAPISGAARWFHSKPIIQLPGRFKTDGHFWFTFFHEAAHILLHGKKDIFLEQVAGAEPDREKEQEASAFAARVLPPDRHERGRCASNQLFKPHFADDDQTCKGRPDDNRYRQQSCRCTCRQQLIHDKCSKYDDEDVSPQPEPQCRNAGKLCNAQGIIAVRRTQKRKGKQPPLIAVVFRLKQIVAPCSQQGEQPKPDKRDDKSRGRIPKPGGLPAFKLDSEERRRNIDRDQDSVKHQNACNKGPRHVAVELSHLFCC
jgi:hypothetical protein